MMFLKALQRPRRVPMRCSNEGFCDTTTHLVAPLHVNLIIFSFCVRSLFSLLNAAQPLLLTSHTLSKKKNLCVSSPSTVSISSLTFPLIDPVCILELRYEILPPSRTEASLSCHISIHPVNMDICFVFISQTIKTMHRISLLAIMCLEVAALFGVLELFVQV